MSLSLTIDNWTLQDVNELLLSGLTPHQVGEIEIPTDRTTHSFSHVPHGLIQLDCLIGLLTHIVFYDELLVDDKFTSSWNQVPSDLRQLVGPRIVRGVPYEELGEDLKVVREQIVEELTVTPSLVQAAELDRVAWEETGESADLHMSALIWGGAGMLARSHLTQSPYFGHPFRRNLIEKSDLFSEKSNASMRADKQLSAIRAQMFQNRHEFVDGKLASFNLPPIVVEVIQNSRDVGSLIATAVELRSKYQKLRDWLGRYQKAIELENEKELLSFETSIRDIQKSVAAKYQQSEDGSTGLSVSLSWIRISPSKQILRDIRNRFGVRAALMKLAVSPRGENSLRKLIKMFGEEKSGLGRELFTRMRERFATNVE